MIPAARKSTTAGNDEAAGASLSFPTADGLPMTGGSAW
jgi:hypothetical protein